MISCMNCGANTHKGLEAVQRTGNRLKCRACLYEWTVEDEQRNKVYIQTVLHRKPVRALSEEELQAQPPALEVRTVILKDSEVATLEALDSLTVDQLKQLAADQGIDLRGARVKADIAMILIEAGVVLPGSEPGTEPPPAPVEE